MKMKFKYQMQVFMGIIIALGVYISLREAFAGGLICSLALILFIIVQGSRKAEKSISRRSILVLNCLGALLFTVSLFCMPGNYLIDLMEMFTVASGFYLIFLTLASFRPSGGGSQ